jgi:hypothetical protein
MPKRFAAKAVEILAFPAFAEVVDCTRLLRIELWDGIVDELVDRSTAGA